MRIILAGVLLTVAVTGCGSSTDSGQDQGGLDMGTVIDEGMQFDLTSPSSDLSTPPDLTPVSCTGAPDNTPCAGGGICISGVCSACTSDGQCPTGDLCLVGACRPGDCNINADCPAGKVCGIMRPNFCDTGCGTNADCPNGKLCNASQQCAGCAVDTDCNSLGVGYMCQTSTATCIANTCTPSGMTCAKNAGDFCCGAACVVGNCCSASETATPDTHCDTLLGVAAGLSKCVNNQCTACPAVTDSIYHVDPVNGKDDIGSGSSTSGCAFKTIAHALSVLGSPTTPVTVKVDSDVPLTANANNLRVGNNITVAGATRNTTVNLSGGIGFQLSGTGSRLTSLVLDGNHNTSTGVVVQATSTQLDKITIQNMRQIGVDARMGALLTIGADFICQQNGTGSQDAGMRIRDQGTIVTINQSNSALLPISFTNNQNGVYIQSDGGFVVTGRVTSATVGTVSFNGNKADGIVIDQATNRSIDSFDGIIANTNGVGGDVTYGNGLHILRAMNTAIKLRRSILLGNNVAGVRIGNEATLATIDLGGAPVGAGFTENGANTLQSSTMSNQTGICVEQTSLTNKLPARGNLFLGGRDCSVSTSTLTEVLLTTGSCKELSQAKPGMPVIISDIAWITAGSVDVTTCK